MAQVLRKELGNPIPDSQSDRHRNESADGQADRASERRGLGIFVKILRHVLQVQYLFLVTCDDLIEWLLQIHPQCQNSQVSHILGLCRRQGLSETIGQRTQRAFGLFEVTFNGRFQDRKVLLLITARS